MVFALYVCQMALGGFVALYLHRPTVQVHRGDLLWDP